MRNLLFAGSVLALTLLTLLFILLEPSNVSAATSPFLSQDQYGTQTEATTAPESTGQEGKDVAGQAAEDASRASRALDGYRDDVASSSVEAPAFTSPGRISDMSEGATASEQVQYDDTDKAAAKARADNERPATLVSLPNTGGSSPLVLIAGIIMIGNGILFCTARQVRSRLKTYDATP